MNMTHDEMIEVIKAHKAGKTIEFAITGQLEWRVLNTPSTEVPSFAPGTYTYRIKKEPRVLYAVKHIVTDNEEEAVALASRVGIKPVKFVEELN